MEPRVLLRLPAEPTDPAEFVQVEELGVDGDLASPLLAPVCRSRLRELLP